MGHAWNFPVALRKKQAAAEYGRLPITVTQGLPS
jgi:hypothetical protein